MSDATNTPDPAELLAERFGPLPTDSAALGFDALSSSLEDVDAVLVVHLAGGNHARPFAGAELVAVRAIIALSRAGEMARALPGGTDAKRLARDLATELMSATGRRL